MKLFSYEHPEADITETPDIPLRGRPVLREFSDPDLDALYNFLGELRFAAGSRILEIGAANDALYIIASGDVALHARPRGIGDETEVERLTEGELFGICAFLDGAPSAIGAVALRSVEVLVLRRDAFDQLAAWKPALAIALLQDLGKIASRRLRQNHAAF